MNPNNLIKEVTILKTWKGEEFEIPGNIKEFLVLEKEFKEEGEDGFYNEKYNRFIKFSSIEHKIGKTKHIALEAPKVEKVELTEEEREKRAEFIRETMEKTKEGRKKRFIERRFTILDDLEKEEQKFDLETTKSKLLEYGKLKNSL